MTKFGVVTFVGEACFFGCQPQPLSQGTGPHCFQILGVLLLIHTPFSVE